MGQLRPKARRSEMKFGEVFAGELARSFARGITVIGGTVVLEVIHRLLA